MFDERYVSMARKHWNQWLPQKVAQLKADGDLESTLQVAARQCAEEVANLRAQGYQQHEAEEVALPLFILLKPEPQARETPAQREELAAKEAQHQQSMRFRPRTDEERAEVHLRIEQHVKDMPDSVRQQILANRAKHLASKG